MNVVDQTPEARAAALVLAQAAKRQHTAARRRSPLRRDFLDASVWDDLAKQVGLRLPPWGEAPTSTVIERFLHKLGWSSRRYYAWSGEKTLSEFREHNPDWPARAWAGCVLEEHVRSLP